MGIEKTININNQQMLWNLFGTRENNVNLTVCGRSGENSRYVEELKSKGYEVMEIPVNVTSKTPITDYTKFFQVKRGLSINEHLLKQVMSGLHDYSGITFTVEQTIELLWGR